MKTDYKKLQSLAEAIEVELKNLNVWSDSPLPEEKFANMGAFGTNTMALTQWIQFVLLPIMHDMVRSKTPLPKDSMIAAHAVREFDGQLEYDNLIDLLQQLDDLANGRAN